MLIKLIVIIIIPVFFLKSLFLLPFILGFAFLNLLLRKELFFERLFLLYGFRKLLFSTNFRLIKLRKVTVFILFTHFSNYLIKFSFYFLFLGLLAPRSNLFFTLIFPIIAKVNYSLSYYFI